MDSFVGISQAHTSNLAVVAPGIAEALLGDAAAEVMRHLSRDLDRRPMLRQQAAE